MIHSIREKTNNSKQEKLSVNTSISLKLVKIEQSRQKFLWFYTPCFGVNWILQFPFRGIETQHRDTPFLVVLRISRTNLSSSLLNHQERRKEKVNLQDETKNVGCAKQNLFTSVKGTQQWWNQGGDLSTSLSQQKFYTSGPVSVVVVEP